MAAFNNVKNKYYKDFTITLEDVSIANALRRICLANIPNYVMKEDSINIIKNTSRFNNEIIKQRIQCIPVHIIHDSTKTLMYSKYNNDDKDLFSAVHPSELTQKDDKDEKIKSLVLKLKMENKSKTSIYATTKDIQIYDSEDSNEEVKIRRNGVDLNLSDLVFPPDHITKEHIVIARLKPSIDTSLPGEAIEFTATLSLGTAKENGSFNVVSTCAYENVVDDSLQRNKIEEMKKSNSNFTNDSIEYQNWMLLDGKRENLCHDDKFKFRIETVGVYNNLVILHKACSIMQEKCTNMISSLESSSDSIDSVNHKHVTVAQNKNSTQTYEYSATFHNEDYTLGNPLVHYLFSDEYNKDFIVNIEEEEADVINVEDANKNADESEATSSKYKMKMSFVGFKVPHPHIPDGILRIIYENSEEGENTISREHKEAITKKLVKHTQSILEDAAEKLKSEFQNLQKSLTSFEEDK